MACGTSFRATALAIAIMAGGFLGGPCEAQVVHVKQLKDVSFGQINTLSDVSQPQSVSICSTASGGHYRVRATGSGAGGAFVLSSGSNTLPYQVQWAGSSGQASGTALQAGVNSQEFATTLTNALACLFTQPVNASLIVRMAGTDTANARAGSYSGTLTILIVPS